MFLTLIITHPLFRLTLSECFQWGKRAICCHLKISRNIPNDRLVTLLTRKGHGHEKRDDKISGIFQLSEPMQRAGHKGVLLPMDVLCQDGAPVLHFISQHKIVILETSDLKIVLRSVVKWILYFRVYEHHLCDIS